MFERIVVGVSKSDTAREAARRAKDLAAGLGGEGFLVTAFAGSGDDLSSPARREAESFLESIATAAAVPMRTHALPGDPAEAIVRVAEEVSADLIVVGNKGMRGARRVLGSVPNTVVHRAPCSVLVLDTT
jgi:nucleotide-binding universal stress UspA family protein